MNKIHLILILALGVSSAFCVLEETESLKNFLFGEAPNSTYDNWISHVAEGLAAPGYNIYAPWDRQTNGFGSYQLPSDNDLTLWQEIINLFLAEQLDSAQSEIDAAGYPYQVVIFHDTDSDRTFHLLRELPNFDHFDDNGTSDPDDDEYGAFDYGWGLYIHYPASPYPHITTAPHANDDFISVALAHKAFIEHESKFILLSGAGREVLWTNVGSYNNSKSLSDPTRTEAHPYNVAYQKFCDQIRSSFNQHEFSLQIHSFDWGTIHAGFPDVQISGGYYANSPDLPIRDFSADKIDIVNFSSEYIHPANKVGMHDPVHLNDYYGFHCSQYDFVFSNSDTTFAVNTNTDLWGFSTNRQIVYTTSGMNQYDNFERFFHVEVDELPNVYPQTIENYYWFHGWDPVLQKWKMAERFDKALVYYSPFIQALKEVLPFVYQMDDNLAPEPPTQLQIVTQTADQLKLTWQPGNCFDMYSYQILYSQFPISSGNYQIIDRSINSRLACLAQDNFTLYNLQPGELYFFAVRILDKNGNFSELSNEEFGITGPAAISDFAAFGRPQKIKLEWKVSSSSEYPGLNIYRKTSETEFEQIASWQSDTQLAGQIGINIPYEYEDISVEQGIIYTYKLTADYNDIEYEYGEFPSAEMRPVFKLIASIADPALSSACYFGSNYFASNGYDQYFDLPANTSATGEYLLTEFYEQYWQNVPNRLEQEIYSLFDPETAVRSWVYRLRTNILNTPIQISLDNPPRDAERIYLYRSGAYVDLVADDFLFTATSSNDYYTFTLYYGNLKPSVDFTVLPNQLLYPGESKTIGWSVDMIQTIDHINIWAVNDEIEIPIAFAVPTNQNEVVWTVPNLFFHDMQIRLDIIMMQGDTVHYYSPYRVGIIPPYLSVQSEDGWQLITHNFSANQISYEEIYGFNSLLYSLENEFVNITQPEFLMPYWLWTAQPHFSTLTGIEIQKTAVSHSLQQGWNLIPNPHNASYNLDQLIFTVNDTQYEFYQAISNQLIEPALFSYNDGLIVSEKLFPAKSYYLYCYQEGISIQYIPYYQASYQPEIDLDWVLEISAEQNNIISTVCVGAADDKTKDFDANYDLLKPQILPFEELSFYLPMTVADSTLILHRSIVDPIAISDEILFEWQAEISLQNLDEMEFSCQFYNLSPEYLVYLQLPDALLDLTSNSTCYYLPQDSLLTVQILISDQPLLSNDENLILPQLTAVNYPNPFNPSTTISFNLPQNCDVQLDIFNIRGQKVKKLLDQNLEAGQHQSIWDGKDSKGQIAASGVYFYRLKAGKMKPVINKILLLK